MMASPARRGNTIIEYLLIGALCCCVAISGLGSLGKNFRNMFAKTQAVVALQFNASSNQADPQMDGLPAIAGGGADIDAATKDNIAEAELMNPLDNSALVEVGGANGATNVLSDRLQKIAELKLKQKKLTPEQAQSLIDLADQRHKLAEIMALINDAGTSGQVLYNGSLYNRQGLADLINTVNVSAEDPSGLPLLLHPDPTTQGEAILKFSTLYQQALSMGAVGEGDMAAILQQLSDNIAFNSEAVAHKVIMYAPPDGPVDVLDYAKNTHQNSTGICGVGNGNDSGTNCQP
jgi:Flp pilus assembly pilin Flp